MKKKPDLYVANRLHVLRASSTVEIPPGLLQSETDLSESEAAQFEALGALRKPTQEEWDAVQARIESGTPAPEVKPVRQFGT